MSSNGLVLIVEDGSSVREMLAEYLSTHGYEVARADRGSSPMRQVGAMSASENLERPEWVALRPSLTGQKRTFGGCSEGMIQVQGSRQPHSRPLVVDAFR